MIPQSNVYPAGGMCGGGARVIARRKSNSLQFKAVSFQSAAFGGRNRAKDRLREFFGKVSSTHRIILYHIAFYRMKIGGEMDSNAVTDEFFISF